MSYFRMFNGLRPLPLFLIAAGVLSFCFLALPAQAAGMDANARMLAKLDDDWSRAAVARDVDRLVSFYSEDAIAYPPNEPAASGRPAIKKVWSAYFVNKTFAISWKTTHVEVAQSGDIGVISGVYEDSFKGPDGKQVQEKGKYLCVWKKQKDGTWKVAHDMWSSDSK
jgi:ketosteroid isomerase-like protein